MFQNKNLPYYLALAIIFFVLKLLFSQSSVEEIKFLLIPIKKIIEILLGNSSIFIPTKGYFFDSLNIVIDKSCAGYNLWLLCFVLISFLNLNYLEKPNLKIISFLFSFIISFFFSIFVTSSRIYVSIVMQNNIPIFSGNSIIHESIGIITNLVFLVLIYYLFENIHKKWNKK